MPDILEEIMTDGGAEPAPQAEPEAEAPTKPDPAVPAKTEGKKVLQEITETEGEADPTEPAEAAAEAELEPEPVEPEKPPEKEDFSDEREWTPDRIKNAVKELGEIKKKAFNLHAEAERKLKKANRDRDLALTEKKNLQAMVEVTNANLRAMRTGDANMVLQAISNLTGRPGHDIYRDISLALASDGKHGQEDRRISELTNQVGQLQQMLEARAVQEQQREAEAFVTMRRGQILSAIQKEESWPLVRAFAEDDSSSVLDKVSEIMHDYYQAHGAPLDDKSALDELEQSLQERIQRVNAATVKAVGAGTETGGQKPEPGKQAPRPLGKTLTPGLAGQNGGATRALSDKERNDLLIRELDQTGFWKELGL